MRIAVLASGGGSNLQALLDACDGSAARVVLVAGNNPAAGALQRADRAGIAKHVIADPTDASTLTEVLRQHQADLVVLAGYLKLVPAPTLQAFDRAVLNVHPALLPAFGGPGMYGRHVHEAVIASGATVSGATVHLVDQEYDRGPIVAQWPVPVLRGDTPESLAARVLTVEHQLLPAVVLAAAQAGRVVRIGPAGSAYSSADEPRISHVVREL